MDCRFVVTLRRSCACGGAVLTSVILITALAASLRTAIAENPGPPATGEIDTSSSRVYIYVGKTGLGHEHAIVGQVKSGAIRLGAERDAGEIVFDMTTFVADTAEARKYIGLAGATSASMQKEVTANMLGADVLNVRKYPTATFKIASAMPLKRTKERDHPSYRLEGEFSLHGVKRPLKFDAEVIAQENGVRVHGSFIIRQTTFGIQPYTKAFGAVGVTDELSIYGEITVGKPAAAARRERERK